MIKLAEAANWREARRRSARDAILDAAWELVRREGLVGLSLRDLARSAGITPPTVYAYFDSKHAIYDAMFGQAATQFAERMDEPYDEEPPRELLNASVRRFFDFCTTEPVRYQLLFQRTLPGFEPTPESYAPAVRALAGARDLLALNGVTEPQHLDLWTALMTGLVSQQVSNDPGGDRWARLTDESITMFLAHCSVTSASNKPKRSPTRAKGANHDHDDDRRRDHRAVDPRRSDATSSTRAGTRARLAPLARRRRVDSGD
ncbi:MAG TPA: TetR/AcrR family transcriptional regulator [Acidimicrobiales bacterium]|nr:TetR/AcrR family transcriptional regulator [Acidimicrobiales bacterium]